MALGTADGTSGLGAPESSVSMRSSECAVQELNRFTRPYEKTIFGETLDPFYPSILSIRIGWSVS